MEFNNLNIKNIDLNNLNDLIKKEIERYFEIYLKFGGYPEVVKAQTIEDKKSKFISIYKDYLYKDIAFLLKKEDVSSFEQFFKYFAGNITSLIKKDNISKELGIKNAKLEKFIKILESSFLFDFISPFSSNISNELKKAKKGYFIDVGFLNYLLGFSEFLGDFKGKVIENFVYNELMANKEDFFDINFWQNRNGTEVDFLLIDKFDKKIIPIEVKNKSSDIIPKSLLSFISKYSDNISSSIITNKDKIKTRNISENKFIFTTNYLIGKSI